MRNGKLNKAELKKLEKASQLLADFIKTKPKECHPDDLIMFEDLEEAQWKVSGIVRHQKYLHENNI